MTLPAKTWQSELQQWLGSNHKSPSAEAQALYDEFVKRFPKEHLPEMTLEEYAGGKPDGFWYWLEVRTKSLGGIGGGSARKFGVYRSASGQWIPNGNFTDENDAIARIHTGIVELINRAEAGDYPALDSPDNEMYTRKMVRAKILHLYFPTTFLPIFQQKHLAEFLRLFGQDHVVDGIMQRNRQLLQTLRSHPEFNGFHTLQMMKFLYDRFPPDGWGEGGDEDDDKAVDTPVLDEMAITKLVEAILPDAALRRACLAVLADSIIEANAHGTAVWGLTWRKARERIQFNVGRVVAVHIGDKAMSMQLDSDALDHETKIKFNAILQPGEFETLPGTTMAEIPLKDVSATAPLFYEAHKRLIAKAADTVSNRTPYYKSHSPALVNYLRAQLEREVPDPSYSRNIWKLAPGEGARSGGCARSGDARSSAGTPSEICEPTPIKQR